MKTWSIFALLFLFCVGTLMSGELNSNREVHVHPFALQQVRLLDGPLK